MRSRALRTAAAVAALATACGLAGCTSTPTKPAPTRAPSTTGPVSVTLAVYGPQAVTSAYTRLAASYSAAHGSQTKVKVVTYPTRSAALAALHREDRSGNPPDLFLADHEDLPGLLADKSLRRVDDLLSERRVDFGDGYSRLGLESFSADAALQCMPTDVSPLLVYYNTRLIDLSLAAEPGKRPVTQDTGWSLDEFTRVAQLARRPGIRGVYIAPDLDQLAPFIQSGGGDVVDDPDHPTQLTLADDPSSNAFGRLLSVVSDPNLTFSPNALRRASPIERFKAGKLGMLLGYRDLTPVLRSQPGLNFDVMPLPRLGGAATNAEMRGLCISAKSQHAQRAADVLTYLLSDASMSALADTGYVMPTNLDVLDSEAFLQPSQRPLHGTLYQREIRHVEPLPDSAHWAAVRRAAARPLRELFTNTALPPAEQLAALTSLDESSRLIFNPDATPSPSPTDSTGSPSP